MAAPAVLADGLTRHYGDVRAVDDLRLVVPSGTVFGLLGPNGAGKTTTLHLLLGLITPHAGRAEIFGLDPARQGAAVREHCGALLEHPGLYERLSAAENLDFYGRMWGLAAAERTVRTRELLDAFGLDPRRRERVGTWSKGMKQKLAIARVLLHRPDLVFLDEPTNGLDPESAVDLRETLVRLARDEGVTVFLNTHNLAEAEKTCDRVGVLVKGRIVATGPPDELVQRDRQAVVVRGTFPAKALRAVRKEHGDDMHHEKGLLRVHLATGAPAAPLVQALVAAGAQVEEVHKERTGLEEAYLRLLRNGHGGGP